MITSAGMYSLFFASSALSCFSAISILLLSFVAKWAEHSKMVVSTPFYCSSSINSLATAMFEAVVLLVSPLC